MRLSKFILVVLSLAASSVVQAAPDTTGNNPRADRAKQLQEYIQKEKPNFEVRENQRRDILLGVDRLNSDQNRVRERIATISANQVELAMALENLSIEYQRQKELQSAQRRKLYLLLKVAYRIKKDGMLRFVLNGQDLNQLAARMRILYRTLRSHTLISKQLELRAQRLEESEKRVLTARQEQQVLLDELHDQEIILNDILDRKGKVLHTLTKKQNSYQVALKEYKRLSAQLATMFNSFPSSKVETKGQLPERGTLNLPVYGKVVRGFGKTVSQKFGTVIYHKGIEIESEHNAPVGAVLSGVVEYSGWVRGLGNVVILHHGSGFYTLNAHLFKMAKSAGSRVDQGETIGTVGDTGNNERPSLYFEIRENGKAVDPIAYFSPSALPHLN